MLKADFAESENAHARLVDILAQSKDDVAEVPADLECCQLHCGKVLQGSKLASVSMDEAWE